MKKILATACAAALVGGFLFADGHPTGDDAIKARQAAMKAVGAAAKAGDFAAMNEAALVAQTAFTDNTSVTGTLETKASPAIWDDADGFNAIMMQLIDLSAAGDKSVFGTCKACHSDYRS